MEDGLPIREAEGRRRKEGCEPILPAAPQGKGGRGIGIEDHPATKARANVTVRGCLVEQNHDVGVSVQSSDATIEATVVRSTLPNALGEGGLGINILDGSTGWQCSDKAPAECTELGACHVETTGIEAPSEIPPADPLPQ